jgi:DNA-directed RNA polymerase specialized sigma24 family protein
MYLSGNKILALKRRDVIEPDIYRAASKGDHAAITWLYNEYAPGLFTVCRRYADCKEQAEDWF